MPQSVYHQNPKVEQLKELLGEIHDLQRASAILYWDQMTYMPPAGISSRGTQIGTLEKLAHQKMSSPQLGELLTSLEDYYQELPSDCDESRLISITRYLHQKATRVPSKFMALFSEHCSLCYKAWAENKEDGNFKKVQPYLEKTLEYSRELASFFPGADHIADPLIELSDYGMTVAILEPLFSQLRAKLIKLVDVIKSHPQPDNSFCYQYYPEANQLYMTHEILGQIGYDFNRGRQDHSLHPFSTSFGIQDVRITTRINLHDIKEGLFSSIHEMGHALYEQGISPQLDRTPLAEGTSSGFHESQSRLWENIIGRSRFFWNYFYPHLQKTFPEQLENVSLDSFYRGINQVKPSLIRTEADEVTYNLHIMIRFDLELSMLVGKLAVADLPEAWNERYRLDLGLVPPNHSLGVMQDIHWYCDRIGGMFQGYTLGNIISAQLFEALLKVHPNIIDEISGGNSRTLLEWLKVNLHQHGKKYTTTELLKRVTGKSLSIDPFIDYLQQKYQDLYNF